MPEDDAPRRPALEKERAADVTGAAPAPSTEEPVTDARRTGRAGRAGRFGRFGRSRTTTGTAAAATEEADGDKRRAPLWIETLVLLVVALGMALVIKTFLVQAFYIPSASMEPGLVENDRILVQKVSYWFGGSPSRGDVIVFEDPGTATPTPGDDWLGGPEIGPQTILARGLAKVGLYPTGGHLVKRVIGVPGDTIVCCDDDGRLSINGVAIDEDAFIADQPDCDGPMVNGCDRDWEVTVPEDRLFVMGDNRAASADSSDRLCSGNADRCDPEQPFLPRKNPDRPFVPVDNVVGKVFSLVWPLSHAELIGRPDVFDDVPD